MQNLKFNINIRTLILIFVFFILGTNRPTTDCYIVFGVITFFTFYYILTKGTIHLKVFSWDFLPAMMLLVWAYGIVMGFYNKNKTAYIFANNAGMVVYFFYYILLQLNISKEKIYRLILFCSFTVAIIAIILYLFTVMNLVTKSVTDVLGEFGGGSSTGQMRVLFVNEIILFPALAIYMSKIIASKKQKLEYFGPVKLSDSFKEILAFGVYTMIIAFFTASKGYMLACLFLFFIIPFSLTIKSLYFGRISKNVIVFLVLIVILIVAVLSLGYFNIITSIFDDNDESNIKRYRQLYYLLNDLTVWGRGSGALVAGYRDRPDDAPYGFELSYMNLLHKFGVVAVIAIIVYLIIFLKATKNIIQGRNVKYSITALGGLCFLLPAIGNPILFAPQSVMLHCFSMYLLRDNNRN